MNLIFREIPKIYSPVAIEVPDFKVRKIRRNPAFQTKKDRFRGVFDEG
jgi:hypothetical protein